MTLKEWCLHYPEWCYICDAIKLGGGIGKIGSDVEWKDHTGDLVDIWERTRLYVRIIEESCANNDILLAITEDIPPELLGVSEEVVTSTYAMIARRLKKWIF